MEKRRRSGFAALSLILSLLVIALIALFAVLFFKGQRGPESEGSDSPIERARNVQCLAQIKKIEMQVQLYSVQKGRYPEHLGLLEGVAELDLHCPITQSYYQYDPQSGRVSCPDHVR